MNPGQFNGPQIKKNLPRKNIDILKKVFVTYSDFLIPISLQPNVVDLRFFNYELGLHHQVAKISILEK